MLPVLVRWAWAFGRRFPVLLPPPRLNTACLSAMGADVPLLCCTPCSAVRVSAAHFWPLLLRFVRALPVYPTVRLGAAFMLRFWWMVPLSYRCPHYIPLVGVAATITDAGRSRGPYLAVC